MPRNGKKENLLSSRKEIAAYLDRDVRTCVRWEKKYGLPVHRLDKDAKAKVFADKEEIDRWLAERSVQEPLNSAEAGRRRLSPWAAAAISAATVCTGVTLSNLTKNLYARLAAEGRVGPTPDPEAEHKLAAAVVYAEGGAWVHKPSPFLRPARRAPR